MRHRDDNLVGLAGARRQVKTAMRNLYAIKGRGRKDMDSLLAEGEALIDAIDAKTESISGEAQADG